MSCLFHSLSYFLPYNSNDLRQNICNYLQENKPIIEGLDTKMILDMERKNYIHHMRNTSTWGGAIEIQVACNLYNVKIIVKDIRHQQGKNIEFIPLHKKIEREICITWNGGHYEPLKK